MSGVTGVIMAGGLGTRLRPLTLARPKPMVEVLGRPVVDWLVDAFVEAGITEIILTTGYRGEQLRDHVATWSNRRTPDGASVRGEVNQEAVPMGTAGSVKLLKERLGGTFVVGSGDNVTTFDIAALLARHREVGAKVTMALWEVEDPSEFGIVGLAGSQGGEVDGALDEGWIVRFLEKPGADEAFSRVINAGLYIIEPEVLAEVPFDEKYDFSQQLFPDLLARSWPLYAARVEGLWYDVGHPAELLRAQQGLLAATGRLGLRLPPGEVREGCFVALGAVLEAATEIVESVVLDGARVGMGTRVHDSLLMAGCSLTGGVSITSSILGRDVTVGAGAQLVRCLIGDGIEVPAGVHWSDRRVPE